MSRCLAVAWLRRLRHKIRCVVIAVGTALVNAQQSLPTAGAGSRCAFGPFGVAVAQEVNQRVFAVHKLHFACAAAQIEITRYVGRRQGCAGRAAFECNQAVAVRWQRQCAEIDCAPVFAVYIRIVKPPATQRLGVAAAIEQLDKIGVKGAAALAPVPVDLRNADAAAGGCAVGLSPSKIGCCAGKHNYEQNREQKYAGPQGRTCRRGQQAKHKPSTPPQQCKATTPPS